MLICMLEVMGVWSVEYEWDSKRLDERVGKQMDRQTDRQTNRTNSREFEFKTYWRRCLSIALQRCNANVISRKLGRAGQFKLSER